MAYNGHQRHHRRLHKLRRPPPSILSLVPELRQLIWEALLVSRYAIKPAFPCLRAFRSATSRGESEGIPINTAIFCTNTLIYAETIRVFYTKNVFWTSLEHLPIHTPHLVLTRHICSPITAYVDWRKAIEIWRWFPNMRTLCLRIERRAFDQWYKNYHSMTDQDEGTPAALLTCLRKELGGAGMGQVVLKFEVADLLQKSEASRWLQLDIPTEGPVNLWTWKRAQRVVV
jgi:hypothetical protein